jgi:peptide-methionine (R)-S-oxide reductase
MQKGSTGMASVPGRRYNESVGSRCMGQSRPDRKMTMINNPRRKLLVLVAVGSGMAVIRKLIPGPGAHAADHYEVMHIEAEWRRLLSPAQYHVLRKAGTEAPFSSPLDQEKRAGKFTCAGCALPLFSSETKFNSGTGWPSFWEPLANAVRTHTDSMLGMTRVEVLCRRCGSHLGHVFKDGPPPTGLRYCMNGIAMNFTPRS